MPSARELSDNERSIRITNHGEGDSPPEVMVQDRTNPGDVLDLDLSTLDKSYTYRWVFKSPTKVGRARARGYEVVRPDAEPNIRTFAGDAPGTAEDNTYTVRDVLLMRCAKTVYKKRRKAVKNNTDERLRGQVRKFKSTARKLSTRLEQPIEVITTKGG